MSHKYLKWQFGVQSDFKIRPINFKSPELYALNRNLMTRKEK